MYFEPSFFYNSCFGFLTSIILLQVSHVRGLLPPRTSTTFVNPDSYRDGRASPKALPAARGQRTSATFAKASAAKGLPTSDFRLPTSQSHCCRTLLLLQH